MGGKTIIFIYFAIACFLSFAWFLYSVNNESKEVKIERRTSAGNVKVDLSDKNQKLFNITFEYLLNNRVCDRGNRQITAIILVTSYYGNIETRSAMRRAFSSEDLMGFDMRRVFLIAVPPETDKSLTRKALLNENKRFGDLIQGNFVEAYRNLTYKHIMGLQWVAQFCSNAKFIIKMDDDIVVDVYKMSDYVHKLFLSEKKQIAGYVLRGMVPIREPQNKWFVTKEEYPLSIYPPFVSGWLYITTPKVALMLTELAKTVPYFWIDDVFITGILLKKLRLKHLDISSSFAVHPEYLECCMKDLKLHKYNCPVMIGPNGGDNNLFFTYNEVMFRCSYERCKNRPKDKPLNETCVAEKKISIGHGKAVVETIRL